MYKAAFVLAHKLREAMGSELKGRLIGGEGKVVEIDGGYFGGYVKPANRREDRRDRRFLENQSGKRRHVHGSRQRNGATLHSRHRRGSRVRDGVVQERGADQCPVGSGGQEFYLRICCLRFGD